MRTKKKIKQASSGVTNSSFVTKENNMIKADKPLHLEIGSGKGQFIYLWISHHYIKKMIMLALEKDINVAYRNCSKTRRTSL